MSVCISPPLLAPYSDSQPIMEDRPPVDSWVGTWMLALTPLSPKLMDDIADKLERHGIYCYIPKQAITTTKAGITTSILKPVIPGYIAALLPEYDLRHAMYNTTGVGRPIHIANQNRFVKELASLEKMVGAGPVVAFKDLVMGSPVRVVRGPMMGLEGILEHRDKRDRFSIRCTIMATSVSVEIDAANLEPL